ncbi:MAG: hypothetical protein NVS3B21_23480 [Acidimicrobiales bacterium]
MIRTLLSAPHIIGKITPREFAFYPPETARPRWGLLFGDDLTGQHWTLAGDPDLVGMIIEAGDTTLDDFDLGGDWVAIPEWPDEWDGVDLLDILSRAT